MDSKEFHVISFKYAWEGLVAALKKEPNLKFHIMAAILVIVLSLVLRISRQDFISILILIGFVISVELTNTSIEAVVDEFVDVKHPGAKLAKDISAGAVLVSAVTAAVVGLWIILPYLI